MTAISQALNHLWYQPKKRMAWLLWPVSYVFGWVSAVRRWYLSRFTQWQPPVPLIVVGNITVGGVGKTPLVMALAQHCLAKGLRVGVVSRGYGATCRQFPREIRSTDHPFEVGDEPLLIRRTVGCPVVIAPHRVKAVRYLLAHHQIDVVISDDGLQHYALGRHVEIAVMDGTRGLGNGFLLPAGPLRESQKRLSEVDFCIVNQGFWPNAYAMTYQPQYLYDLKTGDKIGLEVLEGLDFSLVTGIGSPLRLCQMLTNRGLRFKPYLFSDHHRFCLNDFQAINGVVVMTEKDAIKCRSFAQERWYVLVMEVVVDPLFWEKFDAIPLMKKES